MTVERGSQRKATDPATSLERPRLLQIMDGRFERSLTVLTAGAGFGKSTLLRQSMDRNAEDPQGIDLFLACRPVDERPNEFAAALRRAVGIARGDDDVIDAVCSEMWRRSPVEVALIVDDIHLLPPGGEAAALLQDLLDRLPANAHLVLSGRRPPSLRTARLEAAGDVSHLRETDLAFTGGEQTALLAQRAPEHEPTDLGGWPALLALSMASPTARVDDFVWEEVLRPFPASQVRGLARLIGLDWLDAARIDAFAGPDSGLRDVIDGLPLCHRDDEGRVHLHALWERVLEGIDPEWDDDAVAAASSMLADDGWYREALELCIEHGTVRHVEGLVRRYATEAVEHLPTEEVETFVDLLADGARRSRFGCLLEGRLEIRRRPRVAKPLLAEAREGFAGRGEDALEVETLVLLGQIAFSEWDATALAHIAGRAREIATPAARSLAAMMDATRLTVEGAPFDGVRERIETARAIGVPLGGVDGVVAGVACRLSGVPEEGLPIVERALREATRANKPLVMANLFDVEWLAGRVGPDVLGMLDAGPADGLAEMSHQAAAVSGLMAFANAVAGRARQARRHLERADAFRSHQLRSGLAMPTAARMALEIAAGRDDVAAAIADDGLDMSMMTDPGVRRAMPMAFLVSEKLRAELEEVDLGPCYEVGRRAADALQALRDAGDTGPAAALPWSTSSRFSIFFVPPLILELALGAVAGGTDAASSVAREMAALDREALRRLAVGGPVPIRDGAARLLKEVPARPGDVMELRALGPFELWRDGEPVDDAGLRRGKVRALLQYLVARGECRRDELGVALWPDFDEEAMANNLRVTLSHAMKLLEPERQKGEPAYRLRAVADRIELAVDDALTIDVAVFDELLDAAEDADRGGDPARTLALMDRAVEMYRGEYLEDCPEPAWGEAERTRLRHRFVGAALRAGELRLGQGDLDAARARAVRARHADAYSEAAARLEALVYLREGNRAAARSVLDAMVVVLEDAGVSPERETLALLRRAGRAPA
ncbi:MAG: BTAD domain-containing putative transcriptional regulator [Acidimicrobiales bacterium]